MQKAHKNHPPGQHAISVQHGQHKNQHNNHYIEDMEKVKIKRVNRNKKKVTTQEKILAGLGVGGALLGGISAINNQNQKNNKQITSPAASDGKTKGIIDSLGRVFADVGGIPTAKAAAINVGGQDITSLDSNTLKGMLAFGTTDGQAPKSDGSNVLSSTDALLVQNQYYGDTGALKFNPNTATVQQGFKGLSSGAMVDKMIQTGTDQWGNPLSQQALYNLGYYQQTGVPVAMDNLGIPGIAPATNTNFTGGLINANQFASPSSTNVAATGTTTIQNGTGGVTYTAGSSVYTMSFNAQTGQLTLTGPNGAMTQDANGNWIDSKGVELPESIASSLRRTTLNNFTTTLGLSVGNTNFGNAAPNDIGNVVLAYYSSMAALPTPYTSNFTPSNDYATFQSDDYNAQRNYASALTMANEINSQRNLDYTGAVNAWIQAGMKGSAPVAPAYVTVDSYANFLTNYWQPYNQAITNRFNGGSATDPDINTFVHNLGSYNASTGAITGGNDASFFNLGYNDPREAAAIAATPTDTPSTPYTTDHINNALFQGGNSGSTSGSSSSAATTPTIAQPVVITNVTPNSGNAGDAVTLTGSNFDGGTTVQFMSNTSLGMIAATASPTSVSKGSLTFKVPNNLPAGTYSVRVINSSGTSAASSYFQFTVGTSTGTTSTGTTGTGATTTTTATALNGATVGQAYSQALTWGTNTSATWVLASGSSLPPGLTLSGSGVISGIPTTAGAYTFTITATVGTQTASQSFSITVSPSTSGTGTTGTGTGTNTTGTGTTTTTTTAQAIALPSATVGISYSQNLLNSGLTGFTATVSTGTLPTGLSLGSSTGVISGIPTIAGSYSFTLAVALSDGTIATQPYTLTVSSGGSSTVTAAVSSIALSKTTAVITQSVTTNANGTQITTTNGDTVIATVTNADGTTNHNVTATASDSGLQVTVDTSSGIISITGQPSNVTSTINVHAVGASTTTDRTITVVFAGQLGSGAGAGNGNVDPNIAILTQQIANLQARLNGLTGQYGNQQQYYVDPGSQQQIQNLQNQVAQLQSYINQLNGQQNQTGSFLQYQAPAPLPSAPPIYYAPAQAAVSAPASSVGNYTVVKGDTLWAIAQKFYGDGSQWRKILSANPNCLSIPGNTRTLRIGFQLVIPG